MQTKISKLIKEYICALTGHIIYHFKIDAISDAMLVAFLHIIDRQLSHLMRELLKRGFYISCKNAGSFHGSLLIISVSN